MCVRALCKPLGFNTGMNYAQGHTAGKAMDGAVVGAGSLTDFDYADDVGLLVELWVNWAKTKI